jgi:dihydrofolate synthase / folylpolyglutamate synthase
MQRLGTGPLTAMVPGAEVWLDGGHNPDAGVALAAALDKDTPLHVIIGMLRNKDVTGFLEPFADRIASLHAVPILGHEHHDPKDICWQVQSVLGVKHADPVDDLKTALDRIAQAGRTGRVLICGSLYLAGEVLKANGQVPD